MSESQTLTVWKSRAVTLRDERALLLRTPTEDDAQAMLDFLDQLRHAADGIAFSTEDPLPSLDEENCFIRNGLSPHSLRIVAIDSDGAIVASTGVAAKTLFKIRHRADLGMGILPPYQGVGLGSIMLDELIAFCHRDDQLMQLELGVLIDNDRAIGLYEKAGFHRWGTRRHAIRQPGGKWVDEVCMVLYTTGMNLPPE